MTSRARILRVLALAIALLLLPSAAARADRATFDRVSAAYASNAGQLDPCWFSQADLESALEGIPRSFESVVPDLRRAIEDGIAAQRRGDCRGIAPTGGPTATTGTPPPTATTPPAANPATTPATGTPGSTDTAAAVPPVSTAPAGTPPPAAVNPQLPTTTPGVQPPATKRSTKPLVIGAAALGLLLLLALLAWLWARLRGWDSDWGARTRHAWGEAAYRVSATWAEFTDWLRLGR
ncbi:MAG TPA: hypothetical protein VGM91_08730 [Conexibacter sp.]|jgi:hypothetical protein